MSSDIVAQVAARVQRFLDTGDRSGLVDAGADQEVATLTQYVVERPEEVPAIAVLMTARMQRFRSLADVEPAAAELVEAIRWFRVLRPLGQPFDGPPMVWMVDMPVDDAVVARAHAMAQHAMNHQPQASNGDAAARETVISMYTAAIRLLPEDNPLHANWLSELASALCDRAKSAMSTSDLAEAIRIAEHAVEIARERATLRAVFLGRLALLLQTRASWYGDAADIRRAIHLSEEALAVGDASPLEKQTLLSNLVSAYTEHYQSTSDPEDLEKAARTQAAMADSAAGEFQRHESHATILYQQFGGTGDLAALDACISELERALDYQAPNDMLRMTVMVNLGTLLRTRYERVGVHVDLDRGIDILRDTAAKLPSHARQKALAQLCAALNDRFGRDQSMADLDLAIQAGRMAATGPLERQEAIAMLTNLASALERRFGELANPGDLDQALAARRDLLALDPDNAGLLLGLAKSLQTRAELTGNHADLEMAITVIDQAIAAPARHHQRHQLHAMRSIIFESQFQHTKARADADEAIASAEAAVTAIADHHPLRAGMLSFLGAVLGKIGISVGDLTQLRRVVDLSRSGAQMPNAPASVRLQCAKVAGITQMELGDYADALASYELAIDLLPQFVWHGLDRTDRERLLTQLKEVAGFACEAATLAGEPAQAVTLLEAGRGLLWSQLLDLRHDLTRLHEALPDLAERLDTIRRRLDPPVGVVTPATLDTAPVWAPSAGEDRAQAARDWDTLLYEIREHPDFTDFLRVPSLEPTAVGDHGPVVVVNCGRTHCYALILNDGRVAVLPLPFATIQMCRTLADGLRNASATVHPEAESIPGLVAQAEEMTTLALTWAWRTIAEPVLDHLGFRPSTNELPRMWWCLTGPLSVLPIHAAGLHPATAPGASVLDRVVSSYTSTIGVLQQARDKLAAHQPIDRVLLVAPAGPRESDIDGEPFLSGGEREATYLRSTLRDDHLTWLTGPDATVARVSDELPRHRIFHFTGHALQDLQHPWDGGLRLADGLLTVSDLARCQPAEGALAFLAACQTATGGTALPDENINLVSALQCAGYQQVIGTLWPVRDALVASVTRQVYKGIARGDHIDLSDTATAVHNAVRRLRMRHPNRPLAWAPFVHVGP